MGSGVGAGAMLTDHEPGRIPGGGTPPSTAGETPAATEVWLMESGVGAGAMRTDLEPGIPGGGTPDATADRFRPDRLPGELA
jgi:hypothetical protein